MVTQISKKKNNKQVFVCKYCTYNRLASTKLKLTNINTSNECAQPLLCVLTCSLISMITLQYAFIGCTVFNCRRLPLFQYGVLNLDLNMEKVPSCKRQQISRDLDGCSVQSTCIKSKGLCVIDQMHCSLYKNVNLSQYSSHTAVTMVITYCRSVLVRQEDEKSSISFIFITEIGIHFLYMGFAKKIIIRVVDAFVLNFLIACLISCLIIL